MQETQVQFLGREDPLEKGTDTLENSMKLLSFPAAQMVKNLPALWEIQV